MKKLRVVVSLITDDNDYQREQAAAASEAAARLDVDVQILFADNDSINQSQQLLKIIQTAHTAVDAILVEPAGLTCFPKGCACGGYGWHWLGRPQLRTRLSQGAACSKEFSGVCGQR